MQRPCQHTLAKTLVVSIHRQQACIHQVMTHTSGCNIVCSAFSRHPKPPIPQQPLQILKLVFTTQVDIPVSGQEGPLLDIAVSGLTGWVTISAPRATGRILLRAWAPRGCEIFVRPALPVRALNATSSRGPGRPQPSGAAPKARQEARGPPYAARPAGGARGGTRQPVQRIGASWWDEDQGGKGAGARPGVQPEVDYTDPAVWRTEPRQRQ